MIKNIPYLIIGQGIAGTLLAYQLHKAGQQVLVIDDHHRHSSSAIAAGIINPITGYRFVKSWLYEELHDAFTTCYRDLEELLQIPILHQREILRILYSPGEENDWLARTAQEGWSKYVAESDDWGAYEGKFTKGFSQGMLRGAQVNMPALIKTFREYLKKEDMLLEEKFVCEELVLEENGIRYKDIKAKQVIFCEGWQGQFNPWFKDCCFEVVKGEVLILKLSNLQAQRILKHKLVVAPLGKDLFWVGANYEHHAADDTPSEKGRSWIMNRLSAILQMPYEEVDHLAAIRPATKDRRPLLGSHPQFPQLAIFNGLGAKGASLAPYFAHQLTEHLLNKTPLHPEVHHNRNWNKKNQ